MVQAKNAKIGENWGFWTRIGVVLTGVWMIGGTLGIHAVKLESAESFRAWQTSNYVQCLQQAGIHDFGTPEFTLEEKLTMAGASCPRAEPYKEFGEKYWQAALIAGVVTIAAWIAAFIAARVFRWVEAGRTIDPSKSVNS